MGSNMLTTNLYPPPGILGGPINLKQGGVIELGNTRIYSSGERISFLNGTLRTLFRIENPVSGQWRIESSVRMGVADRTSIWISQEELNLYVKLNPYSTLITMGSTSAIPNVMSVGAYDINTHTVLRSSGRGDMQGVRIVPTLVTYGKSIIAPCVRGEWTGISGTLPAASIMAGVAAGIYQKHIEIRRFPLPNTIVMNSLITRVLRQFDTLQYPNPSQGFGVFRLSSYIELLNRLV